MPTSTRSAQSRSSSSPDRPEERQRSETPTETTPLHSTGSTSALRNRKARSKRPGWMDKYGSVELEATGSVARDHLALERTFLAYLRTSLAFASIGIAITQLFRLQPGLQSGPGKSSNSTSPNHFHTDGRPSITALRSAAKPLGCTFLLLSLLALLLGARRYFEGQYWIIRGKFPASRGGIVFLTFASAGLVVAVGGVVIFVSQ